MGAVPEFAGERYAAETYSPLVDLTLRLGDDALVLSQRLMEWVASAPVLEEDVAIANIALDLLGQGRMLISYAGSIMSPPKSEDELAYLRQAREFRSSHLVEIPRGDFAQTMARQLVFSTYQSLLYAELTHSTDATIAAIAAKASKEVRYHLDHATQWVLRLGDGTDESHERMQAGLDVVWPYVDELFDADSGVEVYDGPQTDEKLRPLIDAGVCPDFGALREPCIDQLTAVIETATLTVPQTKWHARGGRRGVHTSDLDFLLAEMQSVHRAYPGATW
ncbi:ring-1,2-phenylacetyl-CoA epoxidase subunit PaaC [Antricoccus suffuscus]|uniref:Ring-1,2-phenylacetyl-CoA epoxidase subunit PaaC n=1 Tax=Antricoccus suffuscus TaxID=1629062 RepID=A0A2T1A791_9ACTN|nr:1,2-phenylacetyl-CoA epoxidase subunit PaaC [Antricoccus suffuscus]PRZ44198.1 ring-1,2-phenylacetyl-CoA epoxidase subunit PaaC [Antricoccus suffuscus]